MGDPKTLLTWIATLGGPARMETLRSLPALAALAIAACAAPGSPVVRTSAADGRGLFDPDCHNVSPTAAVRSFETAFYMSTWSSAWGEGTQAGLQSGLEIQEGDRSRVRFTKGLSHAVVMRSLGVDGSSFRYKPYCMIYQAPKAKVAEALKQMLPSLGYALTANSNEHGIATDFVRREHPAARWRDRYFITFLEVADGGTSVHVRRELLIARQKHPEVQAESNGGNEAWILQAAARRIR